MARLEDRKRALELRTEGKSYSQIKKILSVGKGTLSYWLKDHPLSKEQISLLRDHNQERIEHYRETRRRKKQERLDLVLENQRKKILPLSKRDLFIAGFFLYWGEGSKTKIAEIEVANTYPSVVRCFIDWMVGCFDVPQSKFRVHLHLYRDMNITKEMDFWSRELAMPKEQFIRPYIKPTYFKDVNRGSFGHGTCTVRVANARISETVLMGIKAIRENFGL